MDMRLTAIRYAAQSVNLLEFRRADGAVLPPIEPGAHVDLSLPNGMTRQYSLVTADEDGTAYVVAVKRDLASRGGSVFIHDHLRVGQIIQVGGPRNNFPLQADAAHTVLFAGGIGITPIWCMAQRLEKLGAPYELHYACRDRGDAAFLAELERLSRVHIHFDSEAGGFLDLEAIVDRAAAGAHFYCCGPTPMLKAFERATQGIAPANVHVEYFTNAQSAATAGGYEVQLHESGRRFSIPSGKSILHALIDAGLDVPYSCEQGICGACETAVVSGTPDHRDSVLSEEERWAGKTMMICCSGSKSPLLVLDI